MVILILLHKSYLKNEMQRVDPVKVDFLDNLSEYLSLACCFDYISALHHLKVFDDCDEG